MNVKSIRIKYPKRSQWFECWRSGAKDRDISDWGKYHSSLFKTVSSQITAICSCGRVQCTSRRRNRDFFRGNIWKLNSKRIRWCDMSFTCFEVFHRLQTDPEEYPCGRGTHRYQEGCGGRHSVGWRKTSLWALCCSMQIRLISIHTWENACSHEWNNACSLDDSQVTLLMPLWDLAPFFDGRLVLLFAQTDCHVSIVGIYSKRKWNLMEHSWKNKATAITALWCKSSLMDGCLGFNYRISAQWLCIISGIWEQWADLEPDRKDFDHKDQSPG